MLHNPVQEGGIQTMVVKSDKDDRYDKLRLSTHDGETRVRLGRSSFLTSCQK